MTPDGKILNILRRLPRNTELKHETDGSWEINFWFGSGTTMHEKLNTTCMAYSETSFDKCVLNAEKFVNAHEEDES